MENSIKTYLESESLRYPGTSKKIRRSRYFYQRINLSDYAIYGNLVWQYNH
ncbi:MAG: hypothetical protein H0U45_13735 [Tatlockia sp.]|nr:hypothetical protein [Tatlockia sp.]